MPDDKATELWDALADGTAEGISWRIKTALDGYPKLLKALEEASRHKAGCLIVHEALATERTRIQEALNAE